MKQRHNPQKTIPAETVVTLDRTDVREAVEAWARMGYDLSKSDVAKVNLYIDPDDGSVTGAMVTFTHKVVVK